MCTLLVSLFHVVCNVHFCIAVWLANCGVIYRMIIYLSAVRPN